MACNYCIKANDEGKKTIFRWNSVTISIIACDLHKKQLFDYLKLDSRFEGVI